ncbi:MAG: hypothetical protein KC468_28625, partial [Myxococcales bacterium]|nr:hypothetical protein [Myxococcales bacterium]
MSGEYGESAFSSRGPLEMAQELEVALEDMSDDEFAQSLIAAWPEAAEPLAQYEESLSVAPIVQVEGPSPAELSGRFAFAPGRESSRPDSGALAAAELSRKLASVLGEDDGDGDPAARSMRAAASRGYTPPGVELGYGHADDDDELELEGVDVDVNDD